MKIMKEGGFSSVFIVMILSSLMALLSIVITASLDRAADSIADVATANAGSSVLTECNKSLHDEFGVLAIKNNENHLSNLANYYISESIDGLSRFVHLSLNAAIIDIEDREDLFVNDFKKQIAELGLKNLVFNKTKSKGLTNFYAPNLPSHYVYASGNLSAAAVLKALSGGISVGQGLGISQYVMSVFTDEEIEYLLFGRKTAEENWNSTRNLIFAIRCLINCVEEIEAPELWAEAIALAWEETDEIMENQAELEMYLRAMVSVIANSNMLSYRIMDIMQMTVGGDFEFKNYAYGFELTAQFSRGNKNGIVTQIHKYTK